MVMSAIDLLALPFDQYQRYTVVVQVSDLVKAHLRQTRLRVLDVGGLYRTRRDQNILPLAHFLPDDEVVAVDLVDEKVPDYALASGQRLPFGDKSFDLVATCDTLEHVSPEQRLAFVDEILRVAAYCVVLVAPFGDEYTRLAERMLDEYLASQGTSHFQLTEHIELGLPDAATLRANLVDRGLAYVDFPDGYLHHWLMMMLVKHTPGLSLEFQLDLDRYYNLHISPGDRREPAYRRGFVIALPGAEALLSDVSDVLSPTKAPMETPNSGFSEELIRLLHWGQTAVLAQRLRSTEGELAGARAQLAEVKQTLYSVQDQLADVQGQASVLQGKNASLRQLVAGYESGRFMRIMSWLHERRIRLRR